LETFQYVTAATLASSEPRVMVEKPDQIQGSRCKPLAGSETRDTADRTGDDKKPRKT